MPGKARASIGSILNEIEQDSEYLPLLGEDAERSEDITYEDNKLSSRTSVEHILPLLNSRPCIIRVVFVIVIILASVFSFKSIAETPFYRGFYGQYGADIWVLSLLPNQTSGFFLDIGAYDGERFSNSKLLEEHGWQGICADPFPHNFNRRTCKVVAQPVGPRNGVSERMADCSDGIGGFLHHAKGDDMLSGIKRYAKVFEQQVANCPERDMNTVGIADLLASGNAPRVIDYVNLDTEGSELDILQSFPFDRYCVRTWTVEHNCEEPKRRQIKELLEARGCRVEQVMVDYWAVCPCGKGKERRRFKDSDRKSLEFSPTNAFDFAMESFTFFPKNHPWTGHIASCANPLHTNAASEHESNASTAVPDLSALAAFNGSV